jgi:predicted negative regulator of RcsB-dependent stress response
MSPFDWFFAAGPAVLGGGMMGIIAYTSFRVWRAHKAAMQSLQSYQAAMEAATQRIKENPERWLDFHKNLDDQRRMN